VTVDDGSGHPKTYTLDFGDGTTSTTEGTGGAHAAADGSHGGAHAAHPGDPQFGPQGDQPIHAGDDGKCVIHDGDLTITAERPDGPDGPVKLTVDDGSGHPTTYDLDYSDDEPGGQPSAAQAMYRTLDDRLDGVIGSLDSQQAADAPTADQPSYAATSAQSSVPSDGGGFFSHHNDAAGQAGAFGMPDHGHSQYMAAPGDHGEAGLASAGDNGAGTTNGTGEHPGGQQGSGAMAGMPMMAGGAGAGGGDQDRAGNAQWRTTGDLFDEDSDTRLRGAFGEGR
jgi:hypothetical protein